MNSLGKVKRGGRKIAGEIKGNQVPELGYDKGFDGRLGAGRLRQLVEWAKPSWKD